MLLKQALRRRRGQRPEYRQWPTLHGCNGSLSEQHHQGRRSVNRPNPTGQTMRATLAGRPSPELAGNVPITRTVSTRSCGPLPVCLRLATSSCMSLRCSTRLHAASCDGSSPSPLSSVGPLSVPWFASATTVQGASSARLLHPLVPVPCDHGSVAVCDTTYREQEVWCEHWRIGSLRFYFISSCSC